MKVIEFLTNWIKDVVLLFIFISIVEIVLPNGNVKRYINMIIGFLIIIVIVNPFIKLIYKDYSFERDLYKNQINSIDFEYKDSEELSKIQEEQIKKFYIKKIEGEIENLIISTTNYSIEEINVFIYEDESNFGNLKELELILNEDENFIKEDNNGIVVEKIEKVSIGEKKLALSKYKELNDDNLKKTLSKNYNIPEENVKILITINGEGEMSGEVYP